MNKRITDFLINLDERENIIRREVKIHLEDFDQPDTSESIVATYFIHTMPFTNIEKSATEIARLQTTGEKHHGEDTTILQRSTGHLIDYKELSTALTQRYPEKFSRRKK